MEELDLKELFEIFWSKKIHIGICIIIFMLIGIIYTYAFTTPKYKSETTLLVVQQNNFGESTGQGITTTDLTLNQKLVPTYSELIKSKTVVRQVIENLKLDIDEDALKSSITVSSVKDTELIKITVTNLNAKIARDVANELVPVFADVFKLQALTPIQWLYTMAISIMPIIIIEAQKKLNEVKFGKTRRIGGRIASSE